MKNPRLNRSLSSVKSLAPCFKSLRLRHTSDYDFICRHCGEVLQPEKEAFGLLGEVLSALGLGTEKLTVAGVFDEDESARGPQSAEPEHRTAS